MRLVIVRPLMFFNACPRKCGGAVMVSDDRASCISCGWVTYGEPEQRERVYAEQGVLM